MTIRDYTTGSFVTVSEAWLRRPEVSELLAAALVDVPETISSSLRCPVFPYLGVNAIKGTALGCTRPCISLVRVEMTELPLFGPTLTCNCQK